MSPPRKLKKGKATWTSQEVEAAYARKNRPVPEETRRVLESLGIEKRIRKDGVTVPGPDGEEIKAPRRGVEVTPIVHSLKGALVEAASTPDSLSLWMGGVRLLTVNELFSIYQYRKNQTFAYKKASRKVVKRALDALPPGQPRPFFDGPTRLWLCRRGKRLVDLDSLSTMFKYAIDALRAEGIIDDDNPNIIVEIIPLQEKSRFPSVGLRLEKVPDWKPQSVEDLRQTWFS